MSRNQKLLLAFGGVMVVVLLVLYFNRTDTATPEWVSYPPGAAARAPADAAQGSGDDADVQFEAAITELGEAGNHKIVETPVPPEGEEAEEELDGIVFIARGRVLTDTGEPIEGAEVKLVFLSSFSPTGMSGSGHPFLTEERVEDLDFSADDGTYEVRSKRALPLQLQVMANGFAASLTAVMPANPELRPMEAGITLLERDIRLSKSVPLRGIVVDEEDLPMRDVLVTALLYGASWTGMTQATMTTVTDESGRFVFDMMNDEWVRVEAKVQGLAPVRERFKLPREEELVLRVSRESSSVSGRVVDWSGDPVHGARVILASASPPNMGNSDPVWFDTLSNVDGEFLIETVPAGSHYITARTEDGRATLTSENSTFASVNVVPGSNVEDIELRLFDGYTFRGVVRDAQTKEPVSEAEVSVFQFYGGADNGPTTLTNLDGEYELRGVQPLPEGAGKAIVLLKATRSGYRFALPTRNDAKDQAIPTEPGRREYVRDLELVPVVQWKGRVLTPYGQAAAMVRVFSQGEQEPPVYTNTMGDFVLPVRMFRKTQVRVVAKGHPDTFSEAVEIVSEPPPPVEITLDPGATAVLLITDEDNNPVEGATAGLMIRTYGQSWSGAMRTDRRTTPADGRVVFEQVPTDGLPIAMELKEITNDFFAYKKGYGDAAETRRVKFQPRERKNVTVILPPLEERGVIAGIVKDRDGNPVANAMINFNAPPHFNKSVTDKNGRFRNEELPAATYDLSVFHEEFGYAGWGDAETGTEGIEIVMGANNVDLAVLLVDKQSSNPISGGSVHFASKDNTKIGVSDIDGAHRFPRHNRTHSGTFEATAEGYATVSGVTIKIPEDVREHIHVIEMEKSAE